MKYNSSRPSSCRCGFLGLLTVLFIGLKLTGHIDWSWLWVLAPMWIPIISITLAALALAVAVKCSR